MTKIRSEFPQTPLNLTLREGTDKHHTLLPRGLCTG